MLPDDAIDFHVHAAPSLWERKHGTVELAGRVSESHLGGFVLKSHFWNTAPMARMAAKQVPDVDIYSSIALNTFVGGFNPSAVKLAIEMGVSVVWLPTFSAANYTPGRHFPFEGQDLTALTDDGALRADARAVLETVADASRDVVLGNGHLGPNETYVILDELEAMGAEVPYLITHPESAFMDLSHEDQVAFAERGAYLEKCYLPVTKGDVDVETMATTVDAVGAERCVLSTDYGQPSNPSPPEGLLEFADRLVNAGLSEDEIATMTLETPRILLEPR
ncbi:DUF6282 family protein [Halostagnicola kamekurae]|uniref:Amidohydrolase-related domain-containing protein n=1 Tax=Halostagnicola kamekurae TaxID=619731 RepID=A0A1I6UPN0_9EURY|nr:DUF6282 family protein [Halostagnicola kamekurae]SFT03426.1 hypothetical protein SAMN04488556_3998 [Halostagnicola kamekurae]